MSEVKADDRLILLEALKAAHKALDLICADTASDVDGMSRAGVSSYAEERATEALTAIAKAEGRS